MLFNSLVFIFLFLPICLLGYFLLSKNKLLVLSKVWLVFCSLYFYAFWKFEYIFIILISIIINFAIGKELAKSLEPRKGLLIFGVSLNVLALGYYKYYNFFVDNINALFNASLSNENILLPLAISFFTFQQIAYLVDCYKAESQEYDLLSYCLFISFFPQLIAGPIVHHKEMMPQFGKVKNFLLNYENMSKGLYIFSIGIFKKVIIADKLAIWASGGFDSIHTLGFIEAWVSSLSYTFQLYFDFSGYSDMAIGLGLFFNIVIPINFNSPYKAVSIQDFWRRWHMTLSRFLRDYIYIPLGGNRHGEGKVLRNLFLTFLIGGFWHGASWMFVIWGAMHGLATVIHRLWSKLGIKLPIVFNWVVTFLFVHCAWIFFRATKMEDAYRIFRGMSGVNGLGDIELELINGGKTSFYVLAISFLLCILAKNAYELKDKFQVNYKYMFLTIIMFCASVLNFNKISEFLYFNF